LSSRITKSEASWQSQELNAPKGSTIAEQLEEPNEKQGEALANET
jgi:hypothetical protein